MYPVSNFFHDVGRSVELTANSVFELSLAKISVASCPLMGQNATFNNGGL